MLDTLQTSARFIARYLGALVLGLEITVEVSIASMALAVLWGLVLTLPRMSRRWAIALPTGGYIEIMRNTPLLLQMYMVYFGAPLIGLPLSPFMSGVVAIAAQHGAFLVEIYRAGIESIGQRQWDAARALGMHGFKTLRLVILPQALLNVVPPLGNQLIILVKDSSIVSSIGIMDLVLTGKVIIERSAASYEVFIVIAAFYLTMTSLLTVLLRRFEVLQRARL